MSTAMPNDRNKCGKKYRWRPSGCLITLCQVMWQLASSNTSHYATPPHENLCDFEISLIRLWIEGKRNLKMCGIGNEIEEVVDLTWQINVKVYNVFVPDQQDLYNQERAIDELIEMQK
ncbi:hypothetical protein TNCV_3360411 [Trichonephila clavipes]|nr:hypothetical protein TNCV_3360411 [Trichonephila clavipes]